MLNETHQMLLAKNGYLTAVGLYVAISLSFFYIDVLCVVFMHSSCCVPIL